jgi:hypothetical protein
MSPRTSSPNELIRKFVSMNWVEDHWPLALRCIVQMMPLQKSP